MKKIAITGVIGSGKTVVSQLIELIGIPVYNADLKAKSIINSDSNIKEQLISKFGKHIYHQNGDINKKIFADIIFNSKENRLFVNSIIHPVVINDFNTWAEKQSSNITAIESALVFDSDLHKYLDAVIHVKSPEIIRLKYLSKRNDVDSNTAAKREDAQRSIDYLDRKSDYILHNDEKNSLVLQLLMIIDDIEANNNDRKVRHDNNKE